MSSSPLLPAQHRLQPPSTASLGAGAQGPGWLLSKHPTRTAAGRAGLWGCPRCSGGPHAPSTLLAPRGPPCGPTRPCPGAVPIAGAVAPPAGCGENHGCSAVPALPRTRPARQTSHLPLQGRVRAPEAAQGTAARPRPLQRALQGPWHPASPSAQGWSDTTGLGSTGNRETFVSQVPPGSLQLCTTVGTRLHRCTVLGFSWGGMLHALEAGRRHWEDLGSPPAHTHPAPSLRGAVQMQVPPSERQTSLGKALAASQEPAGRRAARRQPRTSGCCMCTYLRCGSRRQPPPCRSCCWARRRSPPRSGCRGGCRSPRRGEA